MRYTVIFSDHTHPSLVYWVDADSPEEALITSRQQAKHYRHNDLTLIEILSERGERFSPDDVDSDV